MPTPVSGSNDSTDSGPSTTGYTRPVLRVFGTVEALTLRLGNNNNTDGGSGMTARTRI
jgi:hypothetical protein